MKIQRATPARWAAISCAVFITMVTSLGCLSTAGVGPYADAPLRTVGSVDLERFAGLWYVIESMPTSAEAGAHDATERYRLLENGRIDIEFRFLEDSFDGPEKILPMVGWVHDESTRAEWRVRPFWPVRLAYLILEIGPDYDYTVIGHPSKRYVWIMARQPSLDATTLEAIRSRLEAVGYDVEQIQAVPQRPLSQRPAPQSR